MSDQSLFPRADFCEVLEGDGTLLVDVVSVGRSFEGSVANRIVVSDVEVGSKRTTIVTRN